jgi:hypothetical protein
MEERKQARRVPGLIEGVEDRLARRASHPRLEVRVAREPVERVSECDRISRRDEDPITSVVDELGNTGEAARDRR